MIKNFLISLPKKKELTKAIPFYLVLIFITMILSWASLRAGLIILAYFAVFAVLIFNALLTYSAINLAKIFAKTQKHKHKFGYYIITFATTIMLLLLVAILYMLFFALVLSAVPITVSLHTGNGLIQFVFGVFILYAGLKIWDIVK